MSPTVFKERGYRFFFFSREETRMHVHISSSKGEEKCWLEPIIDLSQHYNLSPKELKDIQTIVEERADEIKQAWKNHFNN